MSETQPMRKFQRFRIRVPIYITSVDGTTLQKIIHLESKDLSAGGLCFETSKKIPLDAESRVILTRIGDLSAPPGLIHGRVVHREKDPATGRYTVGLEFTEFVNVTREQLMAHIDGWTQTEKA